MQNQLRAAHCAVFLFAVFVSGIAPAAEPIAITFNDLDLRLKEGIPWSYEPAMLTLRSKLLDGRLVTIRGSTELNFQRRGLSKFGIERSGKNHFGTRFDELVLVELPAGQTVDLPRRDYTVTGVLTIRPIAGPSGEVGCIYHLAATKVVASP